MPPLPNVPGVIKSVIKAGYTDGQDLANILYWAYTGANTDTVMDLLAQTIDNSWGTHMLPAQNNGYSLVDITTEDLTSPTSPVGNELGTGSGSDTQQKLPSSSCVLISDEIARRYRGGHPRHYISGWSKELLADERNWDEGSVMGVVSDYDAFVTEVLAFTSGSFSLTNRVNVSYRTGNAPRLVPVVDIIIGTIGRTRVCSQRRRLGKMGG